MRTWRQLLFNWEKIRNPAEAGETASSRISPAGTKWIQESRIKSFLSTQEMIN